MKIKTAEFMKGIKGTDKILYDGVPQIAFIGRSNVGKSSVINCLTGRMGLAKTSARAGKTREINFFLINHKIYFVDLPGYGFAKMARKESDKLAKHVEWYLRDFEIRPKYTAVIVDAYVGLTDSDKETIAWLSLLGHNIVIVANKIDKLKKNNIRKRMEECRVESGGKPIIPFSAKSKIGIPDLLNLLLTVK